MKGIVLIISLLIFLVLAYANPGFVYDEMVSEVWFNQEGHLMVEFYPFGEDFYLNSLIIEHGDYSEVIPDSTFVSRNNPPVVRDITELMPNMVFDPENDSLIIKRYYEEHVLTTDILKWGSSSFTNHVSSLLPGQSMAKFIAWEVLYGWYHSADIFWTKDEPPTPGINAFAPVARSFLKVIVNDQDNNPIPNANISIYPPIYSYYLTDHNGEYSSEIFPGKLSLYMRHPISNVEAFYQSFWVEPYDTLVVPIQINMPTSYPYTEYKGLHAYPIPFSFNRGSSITFRYFGEWDINLWSSIKIYDIKGRFIDDKAYLTNRGFFTWYPAREIASGIYVAQMINGKRILDTITFTILK